MARIPKPPGQSQGHRKGPLLAVVKAQPPAETPAFLCPDPPSGLLKSSRERWEAYWRSPVSQAVEMGADGYGLRRWIEAVDERDRVRRVLKRARLVEGSQGQPVLNPLATYLAGLNREIQLAETAFGMTPMARLRLGIAIGQARMTAAELNRRIEKGGARDGDRDQDPVDDELAAEYEEA